MILWLTASKFRYLFILWPGTSLETHQSFPWFVSNPTDVNGPIRMDSEEGHKNYQKKPPQTKSALLAFVNFNLLAF